WLPDAPNSTMNDSERTTTTTISSSKVFRFPLSAILHLHHHLLLLLLLFIIVITPPPIVMSSSVADQRTPLLRRFGLESVPVQRGARLDVPQHVWDIYESESSADWVRHYYPKEILESNSGFVLAYNLSVAARNAREEVVTSAILKLRLRSRQNNTTRRSSGHISIYFYDDDNDDDDDDEATQDRLLIESRSVDNLTDWIDFDVTAAFSFSRSTDIVHFRVRVPEGVEIEETESSSMSSLPYARAAQSAPLIVFSDLSEPSSVRRKRSAQTGNSERKNRKKGRKQHHNHDAESNLCRKTDLYVDFDELGWQDWIMAPKGYDAYQCQGSCPNPMPAQLNASNHAIIQSLLHSLKPDEVPPPCCVPTETSPLSILYMDVDKV
uniref:TGF_BETA_2 domain-containing protein n=2 Tax=Caenorhabditis japonica TaxID=281687 RepID=A0A8R1DZH3_CAEJA